MTFMKSTEHCNVLNNFILNYVNNLNKKKKLISYF